MSFAAGAITAKLALDSAGFNSGVSGAIASAGRLKNMVLGLVGPLAAVAGVGGMGMMVKGAMESIDSTTKFADRIGVSTESLIGLRHAAELTGVGTSQLNMGLQRMTRRLAEAAQGSGEAVGALKELGLDAAAMATLTPDQQFSRIADAMEGVGSQSERVRLAFKLFDSEGVALVNTMQGGSEALAGYTADAERLGISFSRVDAAKVEAANDAMDRLGKVFQGIAQTVAIELAPYIDALATKFTDTATAGGGIGPIVINAMRGVATGIAYAADILNLFKAGWNVLQLGVGTAVLGVVATLEQLAKAIDWVLEKVTGKSSGVSEFLGHMREGIVEGMQQDAAEAGQAWDDAINGKNRKAVGEFFDDVQSKSQTAAEAIAENAEKMRGGLASVGEAAEEGMSKAAAAIAEMRKELEQLGMSDSEKSIDNLKRMGATDSELAEAREILLKVDAEKAKKEVEEIGRAIAEANQTPLEKWEEAIAQANTALLAGVIDQEMFDRELERQNKLLDESGGEAPEQKRSTNLASLIQVGSAEAAKYQAQLALSVRGVGQDETKKQTQLQERIAVAVERFNAGGGDVVDISGGLA